MVSVPGYTHHRHVWGIDVDRTTTPLGLTGRAIFIAASRVVVCVGSRYVQACQMQQDPRSKATPKGARSKIAQDLDGDLQMENETLLR